MLIKVNGYERKKPEEILSWKTYPNDFIDISFTFSTSDPNFKFLQFCLLINNKVSVLQLPVTLLDQGSITKSLQIDHLNDYIELFGKNLKSQPFKLNTSVNLNALSDLPPFFHKNKNKDSRLTGYFTFQIQADPHTVANILVIIKQAHGLSHKH